MGAGRYDVAVREPGSESAERRLWTVEEIERALPWLKRANAQGREILIRPAEGEASRLVLVGGLDVEGVRSMRLTGREPAVVVETSPGSLQAWVRVPACDEVRRGEIGRQLAIEQGADPSGAVPGLYGQLAGFTNPEAGDDKRQPWVLCRDASGREAVAGPELVEVAGQRLEARAQEVRAQRERARALERGRSRDRGGMEL